MAAETTAKEKDKEKASDRDAREARPAAAERRLPWLLILAVFALVIEPVLIIGGMFLLGIGPGSGGSSQVALDIVDQIQGPIYKMEGLAMSYAGPGGASGLCMMDIGIETPPDEKGEYARILERVRPRLQERLQMLVLTKSRSELQDPRTLDAIKGDFLDAVNGILLGPDQENEAFAQRIVIMRVLFQ